MSYDDLLSKWKTVNVNIESSLSMLPVEKPLLMKELDIASGIINLVYGYSLRVKQNQLKTQIPPYRKEQLIMLKGDFDYIYSKLIAIIAHADKINEHLVDITINWGVAKKKGGEIFEVAKDFLN